MDDTRRQEIADEERARYEERRRLEAEGKSSHMGLAVACIVLGIFAMIGGGIWYAQSTETSLEDEGNDVAAALLQVQCAQDGTGCDEAAAAETSEDREEPARLAVAGAGGVLFLVGLGLAVRGSRIERERARAT